MSTFPSQCWDPMWLEPGQALGMLPVCEVICVSISPVCLEATVSLVASIPPGSFHLLFCIAAEHGGKGNFLLLMKG